MAVSPLENPVVKTLSTLLALLLFSTGVAALEPVMDWSREASRAGERPILLIFTADDCSYCERLERQVIAPELRAGRLQKKALVRRFDIHRGGKIVDFDGDPVRSRIFVSRYQVFATPTVVLLDQRGALLTTPLVGFDNAADYRERLDLALDNARIALQAGNGPRVAHRPRIPQPAN
ncbi:MAG TPA: thioredoxin family protein [Sedimenticola thiotaurini]|uniref:Thioredoxin family protein n=1 Tax=Sedimenticola thiotaurini TaxID=1543721 RepID=A0A831RPP4_9GAMM|nr:thioredoxin family protein [Sedimenticola thiotaurini]